MDKGLSFSFMYPTEIRTELAEKILTGLKTDCYGYPEHDFNTLIELDKHEDM